MELTACRYLILWRAVGAQWLSFPDRPDGPILQISPWPFREISFKKYFVSPNCSVKNITPKKNSQLAVFSPVTMWINLQQFMVIYHASLSYLRMHCIVSVLRLISKFLQVRTEFCKELENIVLAGSFWVSDGDPLSAWLKLTKERARPTFSTLPTEQGCSYRPFSGHQKAL